MQPLNKGGNYMLTKLDPEYKLVDGPAYVVGKYPYVTEGDEVRVYVPSMMTEIDNGLNEAESIMRTVGDTVFLNDNHPMISGSVVTTNYVTGKVSEELVIKKANALLYKNSSGSKNYITHIPRKVEIEAGDEVEVRSNLGTFKDIKLY